MDMKRRTALTGVALAGVALAGLLSEADARERHPAIRRAINALEAAKSDLDRADHDFGGHRAAAIEAINRALEQLGLALQFDR
jgi:hypothetical protein